LQDARPKGASDPDGDNDIDKVAENIATGNAGGHHDHLHSHRATSAGGACRRAARIVGTSNRNAGSASNTNDD